MMFADDKLHKSAIRVLVVQALTTTIVAAGTLVFYGLQHSLAAAYGGGLAMVVAFFSARWVYDAGETVQKLPTIGAGAFYLAAGKRLLLTLLGFGIGFGIFMLLPVPLLIAFGLSYLGYGFASRRGRY